MKSLSAFGRMGPTTCVLSKQRSRHYRQRTGVLLQLLLAPVCILLNRLPHVLRIYLVHTTLS